MDKHFDFIDKVYFVVKQIPKGRVTNYGAIAKYIGAPRSSRMVGWAMNKSHNMLEIPAHRVVNRQGLLTGKNHFSTPDLMEKLLKEEGVFIENDKIIDLKKYFWDPEKELSNKI